MSLYAKRLEKGRFIWPSPADWRGRDLGLATRLYARRDRLAEPTSYVPAGACRIGADASFSRSQQAGFVIQFGS